MLAHVQNIGVSRKYWRLSKNWRMYIQNIGVSRKYWRLSKILASLKNIGGCAKYRHPLKILAYIQNIGAWQKYRRTIEPWQALKSPRPAKISADQEKVGARLLFGLGGISNY
jgi:hypothetical protein